MFSGGAKQIIRLSVFCLIFACAQNIYAGGDAEKWREVTPAELEMKTPKVQADADAEAIFWEVRIADEYVPRAGFKTVLSHYIRIKIFTERGRESNSKIDIPFGKIPDLGFDVAIKDIAARTIKPDGSIIELKPEEIFDRDTVKASGVKLKAKSFAMPGIETGAIIEYRWKEVRSDAISYYIRLHLSRDIPVQSVKYSIKPVSAPYFNMGMRLHSFNVQTGFEKDTDGFYSMSMTNVEAFKEEPQMPSEYDIRPWVLVYYADDDEMPAEEYWKRRGKQTFEYHKSLLKPTDETRQAAQQAIGDASDAEEKVRRIFDFCRKTIKNIDEDAINGMTTEQRQNFKPNKTTNDVLKRRAGNWHDIDMLFGAMLVSAGFDARVANASLRTDASFNRSLTNDYFIRTENIAVKIGNDWKFFDLSNLYLPYGMLYWSEEGQAALISDSENPFWVMMPVSAPEKSLEKRSAQLRLNEDGSLEGDVRIEYTGQLAHYYKEFNDDDSPSEREKTLTDMIKNKILPTAEIKDISIENVQDPDKPFTYIFKIRLPGYAERTGKRMFVRPNIFERNTNTIFRTNTRKYDISFQYAWSEEDDINISLPDGFSVESAELPKAVKADKIGSHETKISFSDDRKAFSYQRLLSFGSGGKLFFYGSSYSFIKQLFESFHNADAYTISLKQN
jgi:hypothetical protein